MIWSRLKRGFALLGALAAAGCATMQPAGGGNGPALWELSDADTKIYLFGTIHLLPEGQAWRTPLIDRAVAEADELVIETLVGDDPAAHGQTMMRLGSSPGLPPLSARVPADKRAALARMVAASGYPPATFDQLETWAAALALSAASLQQMGLSASAGVEQTLSGDYKAKAKPIRGLETVEQQLGFFDTLSEDAQRDLLEGALEDPAAARAQFAQMLAVWSRGDVAGIARTFDADMKDTQELRSALLTRRNANWAAWLDDRLDRPGTAFVAVGAGHLAGSDSVLEMLRARGLTARRLQ